MVLPDEREELERLELAGATFLTDELLVDCVALREAFVEALRDALVVALREAFVVVLRDALVVALREADVAVVLRDAAVVALRSVAVDLPDALDAVTPDVRVALRLAVADAERVALRLRFLSHPPPLT